MQWPEETNAVAGGDTFWTLITRDCCIILNWVHLKKSRIIFFVIVTYWQSMARFRKNDFFKWAQKIKSVFCFNPHTHEGCDFLFLKFLFQLHVSIHTPTKGVTDLFVRSVVAKPFQSTHPRRVWPAASQIAQFAYQFQSTHPRRVWLIAAAIRAKTNKFQSTHPRRVWLPLTIGFATISQFQSTHPRRVWPQLWKYFDSQVMFQSTHPRRVWHSPRLPSCGFSGFQSTHPRRVWLISTDKQFGMAKVSIHTPTKGVTFRRSKSSFVAIRFNPHTHEGCDSMQSG